MDLVMLMKRVERGVPAAGWPWDLFRIGEKRVRGLGLDASSLTCQRDHAAAVTRLRELFWAGM